MLFPFFLFKEHLMLTGIIAVLGIFVVCPLTIFTFLHLNKKMKVDLEKMKSQKEILALEIKKEQLMIDRLDLENRMLDKKIDEIERKSATPPQAAGYVGSVR